MAAHDSSWEIFRSELKHWMELRRFTNKALAEAINADLPSSGLSAPVDEQIIKRWRHSTSPPLMTLKVIGRILGMSSDPTGRAIYDPTHLPRVMGILDPAPENPELIEAAYRLQTVRAKIAEAQSTLTAITADEGAVNVVRTATASGLGAAVLPVFEGPRGYPMHVSDRIDLRAQGAEATAPQPNQYPLVHDALHDAFAVRSRRAPRFADTSLQPNPDAYAAWAVQHVGCPRTSEVHRPHAGLPAIAITSVTTTPWPDEVGDLIAMVLGYGFTTTRELARELVCDPYAAEPLRADIHDNLLYAATPLRRVWTHHGAVVPPANDHAPFGDAQGRATSQLLHFYVREDDASLRHAAEHPAGRLDPVSPEELDAAVARTSATRAELDARFERVQDNPRIRRIDYAFTPEAEDRWALVFEMTLTILRTLDELGVRLNLTELHERLARTEPQVAPQVLRWLADHDAPFVESRHRTRH